MKIRQIHIHLVLLMTLTFFITSWQASAHTPHDEVVGIALSPNFSQDNTLFAVASYTITPATLLKSEDGGQSWRELVRGLPSRIGSVVVSPNFAVDQMVFAAGHTGIYRSVDGGERWLQINDTLDVRSLTISPNFVNDRGLCLITHNSELYCSHDRGNSWARHLPSTTITVTTFTSISGHVWLLAGDNNGTLHISKDYGMSWSTVPLSASSAITAIAPVPQTQTLFLGTATDGLWKSTDMSTFSQLDDSTLPSDESFKSVAVSPAYESDGTLFAITSKQAIFRSLDEGETWEKFRSILFPHQQATDLNLPDFSVVVLSDDFANDQTLFVGAFTGFYKSLDGGEIWQESNMLAKYIGGIALSPDFAQDNTLIITEYTGGVYKSEDIGRTWSVHNHNLQELRPRGHVFSPNYANDGTIAMTSRTYFYLSENRGETWSATPVSSLNGTLISPDYANDETIFVLTKTGPRVSADQGETWTALWNEAMGSPTDFVLSPAYGTDRTIVVRNAGVGIVRSEDAGESWVESGTGLRFTGNDANAQLAISPAFASDQTLFTTTGRGLFKSTDSGDTWEKQSALPFGMNMSIRTLALSPNYDQDQTLLVGLSGTGLFKSEDGGATFFMVGRDLIRNNFELYRVAFSPNYALDNTIYGGGSQLFVSRDGGHKWREVPIPIRYEDKKEPLFFGPVNPMKQGTVHGKWRQITDSALYSAATMTRSKTVGDWVSADFEGNHITWIGTRGSDLGIANVYIDGVLQGTVDQYSPSYEVDVPLFSLNNLSDGFHTITIEVTDTKNPLSTDFYVEVDAFDVDSMDDGAAISSCCLLMRVSGWMRLMSITMTQPDVGVAENR